jgi:hypothetical protein
MLVSYETWIDEAAGDQYARQLEPRLQLYLYRVQTPR